jgi:transposase-like protein
MIMEKDIKKCPDCNKSLKDKGGIKTDWYGYLHYYRCTACKETFVSQNNGELEIAAPKEGG